MQLDEHHQALLKYPKQPVRYTSGLPQATKMLHDLNEACCIAVAPYSYDPGPPLLFCLSVQTQRQRDTHVSLSAMAVTVLVVSSALLKEAVPQRRKSWMSLSPSSSRCATSHQHTVACIELRILMMSSIHMQVPGAAPKKSHKKKRPALNAAVAADQVLAAAQTGFCTDGPLLMRLRSARQHLAKL